MRFKTQKLLRGRSGLSLAAAMSAPVLAPSAVVEAAGGDEDPAGTTISEVVMYGVDDDTDGLLRYNFALDEFIVLGTILDQDGQIVDEIESLGYIPSGPHKGLYGVANDDDDDELARLVKINVLGASATVYAASTGFGNVEGMIVFWDPSSNEWVIYATQSGGGTENLIKIDPATGLGTLVMDLGQRFEGLALGPNNILYGAKEQELWAIDLVGRTVTLIGSHSFAHVEALEFAHGDYDLAVHIPGIPDEWTANGVLFGFSDTANGVIILNPETAEAVQWESAINTTDCEGMVFLTTMTDPWGPVVANPCD